MWRDCGACVSSLLTTIEQIKDVCIRQWKNKLHWELRVRDAETMVGFFLHIVPHLGQNKMKFLKSLPAVFQSKINWLCRRSSIGRAADLCQQVTGSIPVVGFDRIKLSIKMQLVSGCVCTSRGNAWNMLLINEKMV